MGGTEESLAFANAAKGIALAGAAAPAELENKVGTLEKSFMEIYTGFQETDVQASNNERRIPDAILDDAGIAMWKIAKDGGFKIDNSTVGMAWTYALLKDPVLKNNYASQGKSRDAQRNFRQQWAATMFEQKVQEKVQEITNSEVDEIAGAYLPVTQIWKNEGKDVAAITATANVLEEIARRQRLYELGDPEGGSRPWVKYDTFSKRNKYLYLSEKCSDTFRKARTVRVTTTPGTGSTSGAAAVDTPPPKRIRITEKQTPGSPATPAPARVPAAPLATLAPALADGIGAKGGATGGAKGGTGAKSGTDGKGGTGAKRGGKGAARGNANATDAAYKVFDTDFRAWDRLKLKLATSTTKASDVVHVIENDEKLSQLNTPVVLTPVKVALSSINSLKLSSNFIKAWTTEPKFHDYAKKSYSPQQIMTEKDTMSKLEGMIKTLDKEVTVLVGMKACRATA